VIAQNQSEANMAVQDLMVEGKLGEAGNRVIIEEFMSGEEASFHVFVDGNDFQPMVVSQDHKARFAGDKGPNTGGMGAYSMNAVLKEEQVRVVVDKIIRPTLRATGTYFGILYAGLMLTEEGPKLVEYNVRLGDPETQVILPRLQTDLVDVFMAMLEHRLGNINLEWSDGAAATVVLVADTYPGKVEYGKEIFGLEEAKKISGVRIYHAGTRWEDGRIYTAGGRVLNVTATGDSLLEALEKAYFVAEMVDFEGKDYRRDIGQKGLRKII
jgi:phosphoribosylamine--glycine ligase